MTNANEIGTNRKPSALKRGYNVQLKDGRWALLLEKPTESPFWKGRLTASVSIQMRSTEGAAWEAGEEVFSRSPEEQILYVEAKIAELKPSSAGGAR